MRKISENDLMEILGDHCVFLESNGAEGRRADFTDADLYDVSFGGDDLRGAIFRNTILTNVYFRDSRLDGADLSDARLYGTDLRGAKGVGSAGPIGSRGHIIYAVAGHQAGTMIQIGTFWGTKAKAIAAVKEEYVGSPHLKAYLAAIKAACLMAEATATKE